MGRRLPLVRIAMSTTSTWKPKIARIWTEAQKAAAWRLPFALFICGLIAYAAAYTWHMLSTFDIVNLIRDVNYDDSFYYFQIAYNLAQGKFSTFDGGITQTNGYHPVWMLLITPFYWIFDKEAALFGIKAFEIMLVAGGVALIALAAWLSRLAWLLLFAALPMLYYKPAELLLGLEAAAALFALSLLILAVCLYMRDPRRWKWHIAALAFALPLVRIEYIAVSLAVTAALCVIEWSRLERRSLRPSALANIRHAHIPLIAAAAGILVYFAYNRLVFGAALPVNVLKKRAWSQDLWADEGGYSLAQNFWDTLALQVGVFDYELLIAFEICAYLLIVWQIALRSNNRRDWLLLAFLVGMFGLAAGHIAKFAQTVLTLHPVVSGEAWYFVPAYLMTALIIPVRLYVAIWLIRRFIAPRWRITADALRISVFAIGAAFLLGRADFAEPFKWVDRYSRDIRHEYEIANYMGVQVMNRALPEGSVVGSWDAGVIGYFSRFPVVNLDGLVNSYDHFRAQHIARTVDAEGINFYRRYGITHFANSLAPYHEGYLGDNVIFEAPSIDKMGDIRQFRVWTYDPPPDAQNEIDYSHWVWERLKPHFTYSSGDIGVVLDGRIAQAFTKDCAPDEPLIWTWQEYERTIEVENDLYQSPTATTSMCSVTRVLSNSARPPVQAKTAAAGDFDFGKLAYNEPVIRSDFDAYLIDRRLIYAKAQCSQEDVAARFFVRVSPVDTNDLSDNHNQRSYDFIEFDFGDYGAIAADGRCWTESELPAYPIAELRTGQYVETAGGYAYLWEASYKVGAGSYRAGASADFERLKGHEPVIRSDFDAYLIDRSLIYAKRQCGPEDVEARFFISVFPAYANSLPAHLRQAGYGSLEFKIDEQDIAADGMCWAEVWLPDYLISKIHTGQYVVTADGYDYPWEGNVYRIGGEADFAKIEGIDPIIRSDFDVHHIDGSLIYTKAQCGQEDIAARFFVSVFPADAADLPDGRRQYGYDTIEFDFGDYGAIAADGRCWHGGVKLPDYPIDAIQTGQYVEVEDGYRYPWEAAYKVGVGSYRAGAAAEFGRLKDHEPVISSVFDVYHIDGSLIYAKAQCSQGDVAARFFMSVTPKYVERLPKHLRHIGHGSLEFKIDERDITADGMCWAEVSLPEYLIAKLHVGQYASTGDGYYHIWEGNYLPD